MTINKGKIDDNGNIPVWGKISGGGKPYYRFSIGEQLYIMFPQTLDNPKAPKFIIKEAIPKEELDG